MKREKRLKKSCPHAGSNYRPSVYKTDALPLSYRGNRILRQFELYLFECCHQGTRPRPQYCLPPAAPSHSSLRLHSRRLSSPGAAVTSLASKARAMATSGRIELDKLSVEQLKGLKEQTDLEVNLLHDSLNKIRTAITRLDSASAALQDLSLRPHGAYPLL